MGCPSECVIGDNLVFGVCTHDPNTGALADTDLDPPNYRVYESGVLLLAGQMAKLDDDYTTGFYIATLPIAALYGFSADKIYTIYIEATVSGSLGGITYVFKVITADSPGVTTLLARIGAFTGSGWNTVLGFFRALLRKDAGVTLPSDIGGTFANTTDSVEAIRDQGDAAWITGGGTTNVTIEEQNVVIE